MIRIDLSKKHVIFKLIFESLFSPSDCGCDLADHIMVKGIHACEAEFISEAEIIQKHLVLIYIWQNLHFISVVRKK